MPEIPVEAQIFDVVFHPSFSTIYAGLLTGHIKAFAYDHQGNHQSSFSVRPSKRSCRGLGITEDGSRLYAVGKSKALYTIDTKNQRIETRAGAHESAINCVKNLTPWLLTTGDDEGVIKLWDPRQRDAVRTYNHHFDYISDFLYLPDKKQLVATSADGTLSVMDIRSKKPQPIAQSEDQEDELLSLVAIKGNQKVIVGTQLGILSVFNRNSGWGDCVDRIPGHPLSIDTVCNLPPDLPEVDTTSTILTGSSDGLVRAVQILPTKLIGVVADHGEWPVEKVAVGGGTASLHIEASEASEDDEEWHGIGTGVSGVRSGTPDPVDDTSNDSASQQRWWMASVGHEDGLRLTDLMEFFRGHDVADIEAGPLGVEHQSDSEDYSPEARGAIGDDITEIEQTRTDTDAEEEPMRTHFKRKRKQDSDLSKVAGKKGKRNAMAVETVSFFADL